MLTKGKILETKITGIKCTVNNFLGAGTQGEVYSAEVKGKDAALKWYYRQSATAKQLKNLESLIELGSPDKRFLWPMDIVQGHNQRGFGYIMPLRPKGYRSIVDLMKRRSEPSFRALITACFGLADGYHKLHSKGLCYRDISFGNVFFDPDSGDVLICDNDNVSFDNSEKGNILGTPRFMAPEIVRGEARPSISTDLFSLAILLFYMLMVHHPLEGRKEAEIKCLDLPAMTKLYGTNPTFIFDPEDNSNRPDKRYHSNAIEYWAIYPQFIKDLFIKAFTKGISDYENGRVRETQWKRELIRLRDSIIYCSCGMENFLDASKIRPGQSSENAGRCWACGGEIKFPPRIKIGNELIVLNHDTKIYPHHLDKNRQYDFTLPLAEVSQHPENKNVWGLRNLSGGKWVWTGSDGRIGEAEQNSSVTLKFGTRISFGKVEGEVRV